MWKLKPNDARRYALAKKQFNMTIAPTKGMELNGLSTLKNIATFVNGTPKYDLKTNCVEAWTIVTEIPLYNWEELKKTLINDGWEICSYPVMINDYPNDKDKKTNSPQPAP